MSKVKDFFDSKSFAVVGATDNVEKYGYKVFKRLEKTGKPCYPVHPKLSQIDGIKVYASLSDLPVIPEAVNIIVPTSATEKVVEECNKLGIKKVWMQPGAESEKAILYCKDNEIQLIYNDCVLSHLGYC